MGKKNVITLPSAVQAQIESGASGTTTATSTGAWKKASFANTYSLKGKDGKLLPATITGDQMQAALADTKNNGQAVEAIKQSLANTPGVLPTNFKFSSTGQINPTELKAFQNLQEQAYKNTPSGTSVDVSSYIQNVKSGATNPYLIPTSSFSKSIDTPNIEASKATINDVYLSLLGRTATDKEIQQYTQKYLDYAAKNPTNISKGTAEYGTVATPSGQSTRKLSQSNVSNSTGLSEQDYLKNQVRSSGEYNAFQSAGNAFDLMTKMARKDSGAQ